MSNDELARARTKFGAQHRAPNAQALLITGYESKKK
jgi:hypothetical protein